MTAQNAEHVIPVQMVPIVQQLLQKDSELRLESAEILIERLNKVDETSESANSTSSASWNRAGIIGLLCAITGAALLLVFGFMLHQANDKGTLVVKADPSVAVQI